MEEVREALQQMRQAEAIEITRAAARCRFGPNQRDGRRLGGTLRDNGGVAERLVQERQGGWRAGG